VCRDHGHAFQDTGTRRSDAHVAQMHALRDNRNVLEGEISHPGTLRARTALNARPYCMQAAALTKLSMEGLSMLTTMSQAERRTLVTAQIAAALVADRNLTSETPESAIKQMAELAAKIAKAVEEAAAKSLG
jgi:hypothetical protein